MSKQKTSWKHRLFPLHFDKSGNVLYDKLAFNNPEFFKKYLLNDLDDYGDDENYYSHVLEQYKIIVGELFEHEKYKIQVIKHYVYINVVIIAAIGYLHFEYPQDVFVLLLALLGIVVNIGWLVDYRLFNSTLKARGIVCTIMEMVLPSKPIAAQAAYLLADTTPGKLYFFVWLFSRYEYWFMLVLFYLFIVYSYLCW